MLHLLAPLALSFTPVAAPGPDDDAPQLPYGELAQAFREEHEIDSKEPGDVSLQALLDSDRYRSFHLGLFDIRVSTEALVDREHAEMFATAALALVDLQRTFVEVSAGPAMENLEETLEAFEDLHKWVKSWSPYALASLARAEVPDVLGRLDAKDNAAEAHASLEKLMSTGSFLGLSLGERPTSQILFCADRGEFLRTLCFTGWNYPASRHLYWKRGVEQWTSFWDDETQVVAMRYPKFPVDMKHPGRGATMDEFEKTGLGQHSAEKAAATMFWRYFGSNDALFFEAAIATNLTIDIFGENNVRTGAPVFKNLGGSSQAFEVFVPGGNPTGGTIAGRGVAAVIEVPLWRETKGSDYYVKPLKKAMKLGAKLARKARDDNKDKNAHFVVHGKKPNDKAYVSAPFFGPGAVDKALPEKDYLTDYEEFFRAYRAGFFEWLRVRGSGRDSAENQRLFATLLTTLATRTEGTGTFDEIVEELYGTPLSDLDGESNTLEWQFLEYVSKGGR